MTPEEELIKVKANFDRYLADLDAAAKDLPVPMPEPGTDMARLLTANVLLKDRLKRFQEENGLAVQMAARALMEPVLRLCESDPHQFSSRPCATCNSITAIVGRPFGCNRKR